MIPGPRVRRNQRNYYRVLHVQPDAPVALITASYRTMMQKLRKHPDLGGDEWDAAIINEAYAVLSDERRRRRYDAQLFADRSRADTGRQTAAQRRSGSASPEADSCDEPAAAPDAAAPEPTPTKPTTAPSDRWRKRYGATQVATHACAFCGTEVSGVIDTDTDCPACQSPVQPIRPLEVESTCQRNIQRVPTLSTLQVHTRWPAAAHHALLNDLSPNGLKFTTVATLLPGQRVRIQCPMFVAIAEIANRHAGSVDGHCYGARFVTLRFDTTKGTFVSTTA